MPCLASPHLALPLLASPYLASSHLTYLSPPCLDSPLLASRHLASPRFTLPPLASLHFTSRHLASLPHIASPHRPQPQSSSFLPQWFLEQQGVTQDCIIRHSAWNGSLDSRVQSRARSLVRVVDPKECGNAGAHDLYSDAVSLCLKGGNSKKQQGGDVHSSRYLVCQTFVGATHQGKGTWICQGQCHWRYEWSSCNKKPRGCIRVNIGYMYRMHCTEHTCSTHKSCPRIP